MRTTFTNRIITALFGTALVTFAIWISVLSGSNMRLVAVIGAVILAALGIEAIYSSLRGRQSLVMRIGPLP